MNKFQVSIFASLLWPTTHIQAAVTEYTNHSDPSAKTAWQAAAGEWSTITFTELPLFTLITDQYSDLGVLFTDGSDYTHFSQSAFPNDGFGLNGALDETTLEFVQPLYAIAVDFPGSVRFELYYQGELVYTSSIFLDLPGPGGGGFAGLISDTPFDKVKMLDGGLFIDDLHFGPPIPAPGAMVTMILALCASRSRRRRA